MKHSLESIFLIKETDILRQNLNTINAIYCTVVKKDWRGGQGTLMVEVTAPYSVDPSSNSGSRLLFTQIGFIAIKVFKICNILI